MSASALPANSWSHQFSRLGHHLDSHWRRYRCVLDLGRYRHYQQWLSQQSRVIPQDKPLVLFDFADNRIDGPQGRRFYQLFIYFVRAGFFPLLRENYLALHNIESRLKGFCLQETFAIVERLETIDRPFIRVTDWPNPRFHKNCTQTIRVDYTPGFQAGNSAFPMAFSMFPAVYKSGQDLQLNTFRAQPRDWNLFFGGDAHRQKYSKLSTGSIYGVLGRARVLDLLEIHLPAALCKAPQNQAQLEQQIGQADSGFVKINTRHCKIHPEDWLKTLARTRFFLACPGVRYPMSHNLIEALAVGSVPILQYSELLFPALEHGKNCLVYRNEAELLEVVKQALHMPALVWQKLSAGAQAYYDQYLAPAAVISQMLNHHPQRVQLRIMPSLKAGGGYV